MITQTQFVIRLLLAFVLGAGIGMERQWQKTRATLRINVLASLGAAIFVMTTALIPGEKILLRTIAPIILGVSLISASVILPRKGNSPNIITGINLWCAAGIGSLIGSGFFFPAYVSTVAIILANLIFQPIEHTSNNKEINNKGQDRQSKSKHQQKLITTSVDRIIYRCQVVCYTEDEPKILSLLVRSTREKGLMLIAVCSKNINNQDRQSQTQTEIQADFLAENYKNNLELEQAVSVLKSKIQIDSVSWKCLLE